MNFDTEAYWDRRYRRGQGSGEGSNSTLARRYGWRAKQIAQLTEGHSITDTLDIGCGDGRQAAHLDLPGYLGVDISGAAIELARSNCPGKNFALLDAPDPRDLHLSMSVMFHLVSDDDFRSHLSLLFAAKRLVIVAASDYDEAGVEHVRHRQWTDLVPAEWRQVARIESDPPSAYLTTWERT